MDSFYSFFGSNGPDSLSFSILSLFAPSFLRSGLVSFLGHLVQICPSDVIDNHSQLALVSPFCLSKDKNLSFTPIH